LSQQGIGGDLGQKTVEQTSSLGLKLVRGNFGVLV
jgi:hypothetical protein